MHYIYAQEFYKIPHYFTYILVPGFKFVYGGCMWRSVIIASLCDNLHSTFYQHIRSQHSWDVSLVLSNVTYLAEHTRQYPALNGPGQCLLKFVSSLAIFAVSVDSIPVHLSSCRSCPAAASMFLRRASHKSLWPWPKRPWPKWGSCWSMDSFSLYFIFKFMTCTGGCNYSLCTPDDGCGGHPKHMEWLGSKTNKHCLELFLVGLLNT